MDGYRHLALASVDKDIKEITTQHIAIVDAIEAGDAVAAPAGMSIHLRRIFNTVDKVMELNQQYFEGKFPNQTETHGNAK